MSLNIDILGTLIKNQKEAIRYHVIFASIIVALGIFLIIISNFFRGVDPDQSIKVILTIGGGFISTVSAYPINQIISRKEKIKTYTVFMLRMNDLTEEEIKKVEELIWKSVEKIL